WLLARAGGPWAARSPWVTLAPLPQPTQSSGFVRTRRARGFMLPHGSLVRAVDARPTSILVVRSRSTGRWGRRGTSARAKACWLRQPDEPQRRNSTVLPFQSLIPPCRTGRASIPAATRTLAAIPARAPDSQIVTIGLPFAISSAPYARSLG